MFSASGCWFYQKRLSEAYRSSDLQLHTRIDPSGQIQVQKIESADDVVNFLTKALPIHTHSQFIQATRMRLLQKLSFT